MKNRVMLACASLAMIAAVGVPPWLAWGEAKRQAYHAEADLALGYARDLLRRSDETARQALSGAEQLSRSGFPPCSPASQALMRKIDLTSTYIQAIGHVRDGKLACSSMSDDAASLGTRSFRSSTGVIFHTGVPLGDDTASPLVGIQSGAFVALFHRELPLDTWTAVPDVSLAVMHLEMRLDEAPVAHRGHVDRRWLAALGTRRAVTFFTDSHLVAVVRSQPYLTAAVAAVPVSYLHQRTRSVALRLVPAGMLAELALAAAIVLLARQQMSLGSALRQGLRNDEFFLAYQPIINLKTGRWVGAEALLRWRRANGELIGPDLFIPVAEQTGTIGKLTERVLELVHRDVGDFLANHPTFHIALNVSASDLSSPAILARLDHLLASTGARPSNLLVEVTERALLDLASAKPVIAALRASGIEVAVDDFGTGYSGLSYLESLDLDLLKIDRSFIEAIGTQAPTNQVVQHIIGMARTMGLRMIAEGVEADAQAAYLAESNVQYAQGWLFAKAMPWRELRTALDRHAVGQLRAAANMR
ncbi:EAL domain-containing protein [Massilia dura]|uniref:cyclic-guanylate-specific phosphodiesterase n=1 Tax=Pseudoduganella dura TaxID=321982 RepID=A0A6I3XE17_9BURK|nr:EAL domain-containing protein [Pseudoduganella dura]MUI11472.1 EAL domain-containing protein [Pseudoduganella dura]GGX97498.1 diguanylate phosphodiesterase [Pseudoduganella dura]